MKRLRWRVLPFALFLLLALLLWRGLSLEPQKLPSVQIGQTLPRFSLALLDHPEHSLTNQRLPQRFVVLNIWASWCRACIEEQYFLTELASQGIYIIGINYKDTAEAAQQWLTEWGNPYQTIAQDPEGQLAIDLGVYGTPETFLVSDKGIIVYRHVGILDKDSWEREFVPRLRGKNPNE